jgi:1,4-dihydroxy-2-naphthoyl-CoA hydrolase
MTNPTELAHQSMPFAAHLGMTVTEATAEHVVAHLQWSEHLCTIGGVLHGGALMALADGAGAMVAFFNLPEGAVGTTTVSSSTNFLRGVRSGVVTATSVCLHKGRTTIVVDTELRDDANKLVARVTQTQAVLS